MPLLLLLGVVATALAVVTMPATPVARAADAPALTILSAGAVEEGVVQLARQYTSDTTRALTTQFGTGPEIEKRLASGATVDVLVAPAAVADRAAQAGRAIAGSRTPIARVGVGIAVRHGAPLPAVGSVDALKATLVDAESVVYNQASTGLYLEKLFAQLGIAEPLRGKTTRYGNAAQVLEHIIAGRGREIGFGPITEIKTYEPKGLVLVGPLPEEVQNYTSYVAIAMNGTRATEASDVIAYLATAKARQTFAATGAR